jgi:hypothetical protein
MSDPFSVSVSYSNGTNKFVKTLALTLTDTGSSSAITATSKPSGTTDRATWVFNVTTTGAKQTLRLKATIADPASGAPGPILDMTQDLEVDSSVSPPTVKLTGGRNSGAHPRVTLNKLTSGSAKTATVAPISLNLAFIDLTAHLTASSAAFKKFVTSSAQKCSYRVLEYTNDTFHLTWPVAIPPKYDVDKRTDTNIFLMFRNEYDNYKDADDLDWDFHALPRYFGSPKTTACFFPDGTAWSGYPAYGWDAQLVASQKEVLIAQPVPTGPGGASFQDLENPALGKKRLDDFIVCLWAENVIAKKATAPPTLARLAIGGFSSGTAVFLQPGFSVGAATTHNKAEKEKAEQDPSYTPQLWPPTNAGWIRSDAVGKFVDELYHFDGLSSGGFQVGSHSVRYYPNVAAWIAATSKPGRKARLIGTGYNESVANDTARLLKNPNVTAHPNDYSYWYSNQDYLLAFSPNRQGGVQKWKQTGTPQASPAVDVSDETNVFLDSSSDQSKTTIANATLTLSWNGHKLPANGIGVVEAAGLTRWAISTPNPVTTVSDFNKIYGIAAKPGPGRFGIVLSGNSGEANTPAMIRHPWSVMGGTFPGGVFKGWVQMCLEMSGFPSAPATP